MTPLKKFDNNIFLFLAGAVLVLWQMLLPGYILTLDLVFTPKLKLIFSDGAFYNSLPLRYLLKFLNLFLDGWIIEKIILLALFFCLGYLAFKFLPVPKKHNAHYFAAFFYAVNPFVYERLLAGHWAHLFAYAFFPPLLHYLLKVGREGKLKDGLWLAGWLLLIGVFSLHLLIMAVLAFGLYVIFILGKDLLAKNNIRPRLKVLVISALLFAVVSSYWLVPYILNKDQSVLNTFSSANWEAFKTASDAHLGTGLNVLALYGFWGESQPWAGYFLWPKDNFVFWSIIASLLLALISFGVYRGLKDKASRSTTVYLLVLSGFAFVFSCGLGETIFKNLNLWLFEHINFWRGFRDSQKFSALLALSYACFGALGVAAIGDYLYKLRFKYAKQLMGALFLLPIFYTYTMIGGFARQLQPVWYPADWARANDFLNSDRSDFKVLFLPWHQYLSLDFNHNLICANPAVSFFDKPVVQGQNMEIGGIFSQSGNADNQTVEKSILDPNQPPDQVVENLRKLSGIKYVVIYNIGLKYDYLQYNFLKSSLLKPVFNDSLLILEIGVQ